MLPRQERTLSRQFSTPFMGEMLCNVSSWDTDFKQLGPSQGQTWYKQVLSPSIIYTESFLNCKTNQQGATPSGYRSFALVDPSSSVGNWNNQLLDQNSLVIKPRSCEFRCSAAENFHVRIFSFREDRLAEVADQHFNYDWYKAIGDEGKVTRVRATIAAKLTKLLRTFAFQCNNLSRLAGKDQHLLNKSRLQINMLEETIVLALVSALQNPDNAPRILPQHRYRSLSSALDYIEEVPTQKLTVSTLCKYANCSPRTLEYAFKQEFSMTPKRYLLLRQLNKAYNDLRLSNYAHTSVTKVANHWGFSHAGQFAKDYFKLFAELPRETLKLN